MFALWKSRKSASRAAVRHKAPRLSPVLAARSPHSARSSRSPHSARSSRSPHSLRSTRPTHFTRSPLSSHSARSSYMHHHSASPRPRPHSHSRSTSPFSRHASPVSASPARRPSPRTASTASPSRANADWFEPFRRRAENKQQREKLLRFQGAVIWPEYNKQELAPYTKRGSARRSPPRNLNARLADARTMRLFPESGQSTIREQSREEIEDEMRRVERSMRAIDSLVWTTEKTRKNRRALEKTRSTLQNYIDRKMYFTWKPLNSPGIF